MFLCQLHMCVYGYSGEMNLSKFFVLTLSLFLSHLTGQIEAKSRNADQIDDVHFYLYTVENPEIPHRIQSNDPKSLTDAGYEGNYPVKILCHGLSHSYLANPGVVTTLKPAYFACGEKMNVIGVDWTAHSSPGPFTLNSNLTGQFNENYARVVKYAEIVGEATSRLIDLLVRFGTKVDKIHLLGFSLGCHCMGFAGHFYRKKFGKKVGRITALDPSGLCFDWEMPLLSKILPKLTCPPIHLMDQSAAEFLDVLHTAANFNGMTRTFGHVDFKVNGGFIQPNCGGDLEDTLSGCSHFRVLMIYTESICNDRAFESRRDCSQNLTKNFSSCDSKNDFVYMGEHVGKGSRGIFLTTTNGLLPYTKNEMMGRSLWPDFGHNLGIL